MKTIARIAKPTRTIVPPGAASKMTHASLTKESRTRLGVADKLLMLSVGIEDNEDL
jgi:cystathionine beta-lyase/cystathionine gamma-synthase